MRFVVIATVMLFALVSASYAVPPVLTLTDPSLGTWEYTGPAAPAVTIHQPAGGGVPVTVNLSWSAVPGEAGRTIDAYRWVLDEAYGGTWTAWGSDQSAPTKDFYFGLHTYQVEVRDNTGEITHATLILATDTPILDVTGQWGTFQFIGTDDPAVEVTAVRTDADPAVVSFSWVGTPGSPITPIADYRHGFDIADPNDDADPGWSAWGSTLEASAPFYMGVHTFTVETRDIGGTITRGTFIITIETGPVATEETTWGAIKAKYNP